MWVFYFLVLVLVVFVVLIGVVVICVFIYLKSNSESDEIYLIENSVVDMVISRNVDIEKVSEGLSVLFGICDVNLLDIKLM